MNARDPKKTATAEMWELQVLKALNLSPVERMWRMLAMMKIQERIMV
jgi:hypothetical protein